MLALIAWRNIWRNKFRSIILIFSIALGLWAALFFIAWGWGMNLQRVNSAIQTEISHIQIHHRQYLKDQDEKFVFQNEKLIENLEGHDSIKAFSGRLLVKGMISSSRGTGGIMIKGVDPEQIHLVHPLLY